MTSADTAVSNEQPVAGSVTTSTSSFSDELLIEAELVEEPLTTLPKVTAAISVVNLQKQRRKRKILRAVVAVAFIVIVLAVAIPLTWKVLREEHFREGSNHSCNCIETNLELFRAQVKDFIDSGYKKSNDIYVMCAGKTLSLADYQHAPDWDWNPKSFDIAIVVLFSNTTIKCENEKASEKDQQCWLNNGVVQVDIESLPSPENESAWKAFQEWKPFLSPNTTDEEWARVAQATSEPLKNVTISDFVFTGVLAPDIPQAAQGILDQKFETLGHSVKITRPGRIRLKNCEWTYLTAPTSAIVLGDPTGESNQIQLELQDCDFNYISYNYPLIDVIGQDIDINRTTFDAITVRPDDYECKDWSAMFPALNGSSFPCHFLVALHGSASANIEDSKQTNINITSNEWLYKSKNVTVQIDEASQMGGFVLPTNVTESGPGDCPSGYDGRVYIHLGCYQGEAGLCDDCDMGPGYYCNDESNQNVRYQERYQNYKVCKNCNSTLLYYDDVDDMWYCEM